MESGRRSREDTTTAELTQHFLNNGDHVGSELSSVLRLGSGSNSQSRNSNNELLSSLGEKELLRMAAEAESDSLNTEYGDTENDTVDEGQVHKAGANPVIPNDDYRELIDDHHHNQLRRRTNKNLGRTTKQRQQATGLDGFQYDITLYSMHHS